jgi:hypothetical protein
MNSLNKSIESGPVKQGRVFQVLTSPKRGTFTPIKEKPVKVGKENQNPNFK